MQRQLSESIFKYEKNDQALKTPGCFNEEVLIEEGLPIRKNFRRDTALKITKQTTKPIAVVKNDTFCIGKLSSRNP